MAMATSKRPAHEAAAMASSSINPFLRSWAWKREHRPDLDRFHRPYLHRLLVNSLPRTLSIGQAPFSTKGFASTVWDSSIVLSKYLERWPQIIEGKHCIELGAGCGLPGITAACLGASSVLLTDFPQNLALLQQNAIKNGVSNSVSVAALEWGSQHDTPSRTFDVILATDVMYDATAITAFLSTVRRISHSQSKVFLAYGRNRQAEERFLKEVQKYFLMEKIIEEELDEVFQCIDVDLFIMWVEFDANERTNLEA